MTIREKYIDVVEKLAEKEPTGGRPTRSDYRISADAGRGECLHYTLEYVVRHTTPHYRYDRYRNALRQALRMNASRTGNRGPFRHVDLGCGPGLFTWVVRDVLRGKRSDVEFYGYDHSSEMIRLAGEIWNQLGESVSVSWHDNKDELLSAAVAGGGARRPCLVTFGHVLAQTHDQHEAIRRFARVIFRLSAASCLMIAVDAKRAVANFRKGCDRLMQPLLAHGVRVDVMHRCGRCLIAKFGR